MAKCWECGDEADYRHEQGSLLTYWWVDWFCEEHACMDCEHVNDLTDRRRGRTTHIPPS